MTIVAYGYGVDRGLVQDTAGLVIILDDDNIKIVVGSN